MEKVEEVMRCHICNTDANLVTCMVEERNAFCRTCLTGKYKYSKPVAKKLPSRTWKCPICTQKCKCHPCLLNNSLQEFKSNFGALPQKRKISETELGEEAALMAQRALKKKKSLERLQSQGIEGLVRTCHCGKDVPVQIMIQCKHSHCGRLFCLDCLNKYDSPTMKPLNKYLCEDGLSKLKYPDWTCFICRKLCDCDICRATDPNNPTPPTFCLPKHNERTIQDPKRERGGLKTLGFKTYRLITPITTSGMKDKITPNKEQAIFRLNRKEESVAASNVNYSDNYPELLPIFKTILIPRAPVHRRLPEVEEKRLLQAKTKFLTLEEKVELAAVLFEVNNEIVKEELREQVNDLINKEQGKTTPNLCYYYYYPYYSGGMYPYYYYGQHASNM